VLEEEDVKEKKWFFWWNCF